MAQGVSDLWPFLLGTWAVERAITTLGGDHVGGFRGTATWTPVAGGHAVVAVLDHLEVGTAQLGTHVGPAERRLRYEVHGSRAAVAFADGRPFHDLDLATGRWQATHPCRADHYLGVFEVVDTDTRVHRWEVRGPDKAHRLVTTLTRRSGE